VREYVGPDTDSGTGGFGWALNKRNCSGAFRPASFKNKHFNGSGKRRRILRDISLRYHPILEWEKLSAKEAIDSRGYLTGWVINGFGVQKWPDFSERLFRRKLADYQSSTFIAETYLGLQTFGGLRERGAGRDIQAWSNGRFLRKARFGTEILAAWKTGSGRQTLGQTLKVFKKPRNEDAYEFAGAKALFTGWRHQVLATEPAKGGSSIVSAIKPFRRPPDIPFDEVAIFQKFPLKEKEEPTKAADWDLISEIQKNSKTWYRKKLQSMGDQKKRKATLTGGENVIFVWRTWDRENPTGLIEKSKLGKKPFRTVFIPDSRTVFLAAFQTTHGMVKMSATGFPPGPFMKRPCGSLQLRPASQFSRKSRKLNAQLQPAVFW